MKLEGLPEVSQPLPWHAPVWQKLTEQYRQQSLPHALILVGQPYIGKAQFALALARLLLCTQVEGNSNCGACHACELSAAGTHGDFRWLQPQEQSRVIKTDQVREAISFTQGKAGFGLNKVLVFSPADSMNLNAYNALLKSLEEPAQNTYLLLVCDSLQGLPATIRSRCQQLRLPTPERQVSVDWLTDLSGDTASARSLIEVVDDKPLLAQRLLAEDSMEEYAQRRFAIRALLQGKRAATEVWGIFQNEEPAIFLALFASELRRHLREFDAQGLRSDRGKASFALLDEVAQIQRAVMAGSNPGKQMLVDLMLSKSHLLLGP